MKAKISSLLISIMLMGAVVTAAGQTTSNSGRRNETSVQKSDMNKGSATSVNRQSESSKNNSSANKNSQPATVQNQRNSSNAAVNNNTASNNKNNTVNNSAANKNNNSVSNSAPNNKNNNANSSANNKVQTGNSNKNVAVNTNSKKEVPSHLKGNNAYKYNEKYGHTVKRFDKEPVIMKSYNNSSYFFNNGYFYQYVKNIGYVWIESPYGLIISALPSDAVIVIISGRQYYYYENIYFEACRNGFEIVKLPSKYYESKPTIYFSINF